MNQMYLNQMMMNQKGMNQNNMNLQNQMMNNPQIQMSMNQMQMRLGNMNNAMMMNNLNEEKVNENNELNSKKEENSPRNIYVDFSYQGKSLSIQCSESDKFSDIIEKFRKETNFNIDELKFYRNSKEIKPSSNIRLQNLENIDVVPAKYVIGAGETPILFTDVSKNKTKEMKRSSKRGPRYREATKGINIIGICNYKKCKVYKKQVIVKIKKKKI